MASFHPRSLARQLNTFALLSIVLLGAAACGKSGGKGSGATQSNVIASGIVGPAGGTIAVQHPTSPFFGTQIVVPPGALTAPTLITISIPDASFAPRDAFSFTLEPDGQTFALPVTLTIKYADQYLTDFGIADETTLRIFSRQSDQTFEILDTLSQDVGNNTITAQTTHFSVVAAMLLEFAVTPGSTLQAYHANLYAMPNALVDPSVPINYKTTPFGTRFIAANGASSQSVGKGSLAGFKTSSQNLIIVHGFTSTPLDFDGSNDLWLALSPHYDNIVLYQYPSGLSISQNGSDLADRLQAIKLETPAFKTDIVAHSMGGLVARYAIESNSVAQSAVAHLATLGTPHAGASTNDLFANYLLGLPTTPTLLQLLVPGLSDLLIGSTFLIELNGLYSDNSTEYFAIAGDDPSGSGADGVVEVSSATAIPAPFPMSSEESLLFSSNGFQYDHSKLHTEARVNGVASFLMYVLDVSPPIWARTYWGNIPNGTYLARGASVARTRDAGYIVACTNEGFGASGIFAWIIKLNNDGMPAWQMAYGGGLDDGAKSVQQTSDGSYIVAGDSSSFGAYDAWLLRINGAGSLTLQRSFGDNGLPGPVPEPRETAMSLQQTADGGYVFAGHWTTGPFGSDPETLWVVRLDATGAFLWQKGYDMPSTDAAASLVQTSDGGFIVAGKTFGDAWILKLNPEGSIAWQQRYGGVGNEEATAIRQTSDGGYVFSGWTSSFGAGGNDVWVVKLNSDGTIAWQKAYGGASNDAAQDIRQTTDGGYIIAGRTESFGAGSGDIWVLRLNPDGTIAWQKAYGGTNVERAFAVQEALDGGFIAVGYTDSYWGYSAGRQLWILKLASDGGLGSLGVATGSGIVDTVASSTITGVVPFDTAVISTNTAATITATDAQINQQAP